MNPHPEWDEDFYKLLGVERSATLSEIASAYHQAKNAYSKDSPATYSLFTAEENQAMLAKLERGYLTLSNIDKKREYDRWLDGGSSTPADAVENYTTKPALHPTDMPTFFADLSAAKPSEPLPRPTAIAPVAPVVYAVPDRVSTGINLERPDDTQSIPAAPSLAETSTQLVRPVEIAKSDAVDGNNLRLIREKLGLTAEDVCRITKIPSRYLKAIESSRPDDLPARVYLQGFIKNLAKLYHLDPKTTVEAYLKSVAESTQPNLQKSAP